MPLGHGLLRRAGRKCFLGHDRQLVRRVPAPGAPAWGLVSRVGNGPWVHVGSGPTTLSGTGELVFAANDDLFPDNTDNFVVTVSFECWPGWGHGDDKHPRCGPPGGEKKPKYDRSPDAVLPRPTLRAS